MRRSSAVLLGLLACILVVCALVWPEVMRYRRSWREIEGKQRGMLYQVNHEAFMQAGREMWEAWRLQPSARGYESIDPADPKLPALIRGLGAHGIDVYASGINIEMGGQGCHYGFELYFEDAGNDKLRTMWKAVFPAKEVRPGMWYYAENGIIAR